MRILDSLYDSIDRLYGDFRLVSDKVNSLESELQLCYKERNDIDDVRTKEQRYMRLLEAELMNTHSLYHHCRLTESLGDLSVGTPCDDCKSVVGGTIKYLRESAGLFDEN